jgi:hypothetical protein
MENTSAYLSDSTDSTTIFLEKGLKMVNETAKLWDRAEANSTSSDRRICCGQMWCDALTRILIWLAHQPRDQNTVKQELDELYHMRGFAHLPGPNPRLIKMFDEAVVCNSEKDQTKAQSETGSSISFTS